MINIVKKYKLEILFSISFLLMGMLVGYFSNSNGNYWYYNLNKPSFTPPSYIFPIVWTVLYLMLGVIFAKIWQIKKYEGNQLLAPIFILQLIINLTWSPLFFFAQRIDLALYNIIILWSLLARLLYMLRKETFILILFIPYFMWISLALVLNYYIYILN